LQIGGQKVKSKTVHGTVSPHWDEELMLCWDGIESLTVDIFSSDEHMGCASLPLDFLLDEEDEDGEGGASEKLSVNSNLPDLGRIGEEGEEDEDDIEDDTLLGNQTKSGEKKGANTNLFLPLESRDVNKVGKKVKGLKSTARKIGRGSVFNPRQASGGVYISVEFERLAH